VQELQDQPEGLPGILDPPGGTVNDAEMAVKTLVALISRIMQKEGSEELADDIDRHTKLFLSYIDLLDKKMHTRSRQGQVGEEEDINKPIWLRNPNLVNLLSLANVMQKFGSLCDLWEGSAIGEGIIHWLKPLINGMHSVGNWAVCAMQKCYQLKAINIIVNDLHNDEVFDPFGDENEMEDDEDENVFDKICMMMTRLACNQAIESLYWRMDNNSDVGLLMGYVLYRLPIELESMDLDTFSH
jgi:hypothetical protein